MNIDNFSVEFHNKILIVTSRDGVTKDDALKAKSILEESTGHDYYYVMYKDKLGYYKCYDFLRDNSVYCATLKKTYAIELITKYIKENESH